MHACGLWGHTFGLPPARNAREGALQIGLGSESAKRRSFSVRFGRGCLSPLPVSWRCHVGSQKQIAVQPLGNEYTASQRRSWMKMATAGRRSECMPTLFDKPEEGEGGDSERRRRRHTRHTRTVYHSSCTCTCVHFRFTWGSSCRGQSSEQTG